MNTFPGSDALQGLLMPSASQMIHPVQASPELVNRFEQMMQQTPISTESASTNGVGNSPLVTALIDRVELHMNGHAQVIERAASIDPSNMSAAEIDKIQIETVVQMGLLSMNQSAFFEILGSTKSAVSSLMKNQ